MLVERTVRFEKFVQALVKAHHLLAMIDRQSGQEEREMLTVINHSMLM